MWAERLLPLASVLSYVSCVLLPSCLTILAPTQGKNTLARKFFLCIMPGMMTLSEYLREQGRGAAAKLARDTGLSESQIMRLSRGGVPLVTTALRIEAATSGKVPPEAWGAPQDDAA